MSHDPIDGEYNSLLMCNIISHKITGKTVSLYLPPCDSPDMIGAINYSTALLPAVDRIQVFNAGEEDDGYALGMDGQWWCDQR